MERMCVYVCVCVPESTRDICLCVCVGVKEEVMTTEEQMFYLSNSGCLNLNFNQDICVYMCLYVCVSVILCESICMDIKNIYFQMAHSPAVPLWCTSEQFVCLCLAMTFDVCSPLHDTLLDKSLSYSETTFGGSRCPPRCEM